MFDATLRVLVVSCVQYVKFKSDISLLICSDGLCYSGSLGHVRSQGFHVDRYVMVDLLIVNAPCRPIERKFGISC